MPTVRLTERVVFQGGKVRRPGVDGYAGAYPIVEGVLLCGAKSANKRRYLPEAFAGDRIRRYNGRPVFLNHGKGRESRQYQDKIACVENERVRSDGMPVADLAVNPKHHFAEAFLWDAEHKPNSCGMSHVAHCETREASDGWTEVTEVVEVESVDVVVDPATTKGLHENKGSPMTTLRKFLESHGSAFKDADTQKRARKALVEMDDGGAMASMSDMPMDEPGEGVEPEDHLWSGFQQAITAILDKYKSGEGDAGSAVKEIGKYIKAHAKLTTGKDDAPAEEPSEPKDDADKPKDESKKPNPWDVLKECASEHYTPTPTELELLSLMPTAEKRKAYIAEQRAKGVKPEKPKSGGNPATPLKEEKVPTDGTGFFASIRA